MIRVNLSTGQTVAFDLANEQQARAWAEAKARESFQSQIRRIAVVVREEDQDAARFVCPIPQGVRVTQWDAELVRDAGGKPVREQVTCYADQYALVLAVYLDPLVPTARVDWFRTGRLRLRRPD